MQSKAPVLLLIYNRPAETNKVFEAIRNFKPTKLFISADGPRDFLDTDLALVREARTVVDKVDWPCEVRTNFRDKNLGLKRAVGEGITWFFDHVEEGIILEDDCLASPDFFDFCTELLTRYRNEERIWAITGNNFQGGVSRGSASYYFSSFPHVWGWATWRRCWSQYDPEYGKWPGVARTEEFHSFIPERRIRKFWERLFKQGRRGKFDSSWAYPWTATVLGHRGLTATPNKNLVSNIGFGEFATHTKDSKSSLANLQVSNLRPLRHPKTLVRDVNADLYTLKVVFQGSLVNRFVVRFSSISVVGRLAAKIKEKF